MTDDEAVWVVSDVAPDGTYVVGLHYGPDTAWVLDRNQALRYAAAVAAAAARAAYDAAMMRQLTNKLGMPLASAAGFIADVRADRPPLDDAALEPLGLNPGVSAFTGEPFIRITVSGKLVGQWSPADALQHSTHVLEVLAGVDLDAGYYRALTATGVDEARMRAAVEDLANFRGGADV